MSQGVKKPQNLGHLPQVRNHTKRSHTWEKWTKREIAVLLGHPDMTAVELHKGFLPRHTPKAIQRMRERQGRWNRRNTLCCRCHVRPVWVESASAKRLELCKGCYLDEKECRALETKRDTMLRQRMSRKKRSNP